MPGPHESQVLTLGLRSEAGMPRLALLALPQSHASYQPALHQGWCRKLIQSVVFQREQVPLRVCPDGPHLSSQTPYHLGAALMRRVGGQRTDWQGLVEVKGVVLELRLG